MTVSKNYLGRFSKERGDLDLIIDDLNHVKECANLILRKLDEPITVSSIGLMEISLLDSALIRYRRCFNKGIRNPLKIDFTSEEDKIHEAHYYFMNIADKHVAHSVNSFENAGVSVSFVKSDQKNKYSPEKVSVAKFKTLMISAAEIRILLFLADYFVGIILRRIKALDDLIINDTAAMEKFEIELLKKRMPISKDHVKRQKHGKQRLV